MLVVCWCLIGLVGYTGLIAYGGTPGRLGSSPSDWPNFAPLARMSNRPTLLVFIHPNCPCSQATLSELERLLAEIKNPVQLTILLTCPSNPEPSWSESSLARRCYGVPGAEVVIDSDGRMAERFAAATTSGECILYAADGKRLFQGGITSGRGHEGESFGRIAIRSLLGGLAVERARQPVFGCELVKTNSPAQQACTNCPKDVK